MHYEYADARSIEQYGSRKGVRRKVRMTETNKHNLGQESVMPESGSTGEPEKEAPVESSSSGQKEPPRSSGQEAPPTSVEHTDSTARAQEYVSRLTEEEQMLIMLHRELYENSWQAMLNDLRNRLDGKPYIFKLASRIQDDIARIEKLQSFEREHNVKLSEFVKPP